MEISELIKNNIKYLTALSKNFPTIQSVSTEIINLKAILDLPKGTEHFVSDIHGEHEAFIHILNSASGVIHEKIDILFGKTQSLEERKKLATLIYYPSQKLQLIKDEVENIDEWYKKVLVELIEICRLVSSKYTRSKVRKALPKDFAYILDELLHAGHDGKNKDEYYNEIIKAIIEIDRADAFIVALADVIKRLAVDRLHIVGDIFDRGERPDIIMDTLMNHHSVDIQWGNHDILWMGAAAGSETCISNVLNICLRFSALDLLEIGYGISLRPLMTFAETTYTEGDQFKPKQYGEYLGDYDKLLLAKMRKAITVILFKTEGAIIKRNPLFEMQPRLLLDKINYQDKTVTIDDNVYPIKDVNFPTINPDDPYALTDEEKLVIAELKRAFMQSEKLQKHIAFLYSKG
ncbi:MAG: fructose-bisphosphatase class III, partial [Oscillospiraceae bacterium]